ncbi:hypothetical protein GCM10010505_14650 [Kitasatospora aburaviensis]
MAAVAGVAVSGAAAACGAVVVGAWREASAGVFGKAVVKGSLGTGAGAAAVRPGRAGSVVRAGQWRVKAAVFSPAHWR